MSEGSHVTPVIKTISRHDATIADDEVLIGRVLAGDTAAFEPLMRRYNERVYRVARSIVRDDTEAEDVMQQAYVNAFTHLRQFKGAARFATWLTRIAINEALARTRHPIHEQVDESRKVVPFMTRHPSDDPEREALRGELRLLLEWAIDTLPGGLREVFVLRDVEGLSTYETAQCLGVSEDVVKTRLSRGRARLRRRLMQRTGAAAPDAFRFLRPRCDRVVAAVLGRIAEDSPGHGRGRPSLVVTVGGPPEGTAIAGGTTDGVLLTPAQLATIRRELTAALDHVDSLDHLCSIRELATGVEDGVSAALHILDAAEPVTTSRAAIGRKNTLD